MANLIECDLPSDQKKLILRYAAHYPHRWRSKIRDDWDRPVKLMALNHIEECTLQQMRNTIGPSGLNNFVVRSDGVVCYSQSFIRFARQNNAFL